MGETPWLKWTGGDCPVPACNVLIRYRDGKESKEPVPAARLAWQHTNLRSERGAHLDIVAYRIMP